MKIKKKMSLEVKNKNKQNDLDMRIIPKLSNIHKSVIQYINKTIQHRSKLKELKRHPGK